MIGDDLRAGDAQTAIHVPVAAVGDAAKILLPVGRFEAAEILQLLGGGVIPEQAAFG